MVERVPLTGQRLEQWLREAEMFYVNSDPTGRLSSQVTRLIAELRPSRAREQELQQRIDKALAVCQFAKLSDWGSPDRNQLIDGVRAALTGTEATDA